MDRRPKTETEVEALWILLGFCFANLGLERRRETEDRSWKSEVCSLRYSQYPVSIPTTHRSIPKNAEFKYKYLYPFGGFSLRQSAHSKMTVSGTNQFKIQDSKLKNPNLKLRNSEFISLRKFIVTVRKFG